jgi:electron transport complex protein RnfC
MALQLFRHLTTPRLKYELLPAKLPDIERIFPRRQVTLHHPRPDEHARTSDIRTGDAITAGEKICLLEDAEHCVVSPYSGRISSVAPYSGNYGRQYLAVTIDIDRTDSAGGVPAAGPASPDTLEPAMELFANLPGAPRLQIFADPEATIHTLIVRGIDEDLLIRTNQYILRARLDALSRGIQWLKSATGVERIVLATPRETLQGYGHLGAEVIGVDPTYPAALQEMLLLQVLGRELPAGQHCENLGVGFFSAEAVAAIGAASENGRLPLHKILTFIDKNGRPHLVETPIGTPIRDLFGHYDVPIEDEDQIVFGGPMRGLAVYSMDHPVQPDTDGIMVLDRFKTARSTEYPCVNCGDCVRICPARIPINLLVRFLEAGHYETAADDYDLYSCIECGLCSYVCISKIPLLQHIKLAKYELERAQKAEASNA